MSYKSRISNLKKFSWTVSGLAITALLAPQAMAEPEQLPTVEIHFEVLDKFLSQDVNMQPPGASPFSTQPSEPLKHVKPSKKAVAKKASEPKKTEPNKVDLEAGAAKPVATHKLKLTAKEKAAVAKGEATPLAIPSSKMKEMPLQLPPDLQPAPAPEPVPAPKEKEVSVHKPEPKADKKPEPKAEPVVPKMEPVPPAPVMPPMPPKAEPTPPPAPVPAPAALPMPPKAEPAPPPAPPASVPPMPVPAEKPAQVPLIMPEAAAPAPAPKIPEVPGKAPEASPKIEPVPQPVPMPTAALPEKTEPQKALITPMPPAPTPEDEFAKALNMPVSPKEAAVPTPPAAVPAEPVAPAPVAPPPAAPEVKKEVPQPPPPAPSADTHKDAPAKAATQNGKTQMTIPFIATETDLPLAFEGELKNLADRVKKSDEHLTLVAYASEPADQSTMARRVSLSRVLAVRAFLIEKGVNKLNINVQAEGSKNPGGEPNRVDIFINDGKSK